MVKKIVARLPIQCIILFGNVELKKSVATKTKIIKTAASEKILYILRLLRASSKKCTLTTAKGINAKIPVKTIQNIFFPPIYEIFEIITFSAEICLKNFFAQNKKLRPSRQSCAENLGKFEMYEQCP